MDRAEAQKALQACIADEQTYQFTSFSHRDAWELGHALVDACEKMGAPLAVEIEINHVIVFRYYPDGTGAYHEQWLRRKRNLVNLLEKSSQRAYYELEVNCEDQERDWRLPRSRVQRRVPHPHPRRKRHRRRRCLRPPGPRRPDRPSERPARLF